MTEKEKSEINKPSKKARVSEIKSPNSFIKKPNQPNGNERQSLLSIWMKKYEDCGNRRRPEFEGRSMTIAPLYTHLSESLDQSFNSNNN